MTTLVALRAHPPHVCRGCGSRGTFPALCTRCRRFAPAIARARRREQQVADAAFVEAVITVDPTVGLPRCARCQAVRTARRCPRVGAQRRRRVSPGAVGWAVFAAAVVCGVAVWAVVLIAATSWSQRQP